MDKGNGWLNCALFAGAISAPENAPPMGLYVVHWDSAGTDGGAAADESSMRISRRLRAIAMRLSKSADRVAGWTQAGNRIVMVVSFAEREAGEREIAAGRMAFLIRDTALRVLTEFGCPEANAPGGSLRCGFGWLTPETAETPDRSSLARDWEDALLSAYETAWQSMFFSAAPMIGFPLERMYGLSGIDFEVRYLPIVSLLDGSLYGYEAYPVEAGNGERIDLREFYAQADRSGKLFEWDRRFREKAIRGLPSRSGDVKLFMPVPAKIIFDPRLYPGSTLRSIEAASLRPEHVVLVLVGGDSESSAMTESALNHYRHQGFRIALAGIEPRLESLRRLTEFHPDYAQVNVGWMSGNAADPVDESLLQALVEVARRERIVMIACGHHLHRYLPGLVGGGMNYAEWNGLGGYPAKETEALLADLRERIREEVGKRFLGAAGTMSELVRPVRQFGRDTPVSEASRYFEAHREAQGIVIADAGGKPIGLIMKEKLLQLLSGQFGLPLYWNKSVGKIMDTHPMIVEESVSVDQASQMAMAREPDKLYDEVIITREGAVSGIASIRSMLEWISQSRMTAAQWANPLTGLPGNEPIRKELVRRLAAGRPFEVLYADLDHFKWYNDHYGFQRGDEVIRFTGDSLSRFFRSLPGGDCFVGHIGGDDFIVICSGFDALSAAKEAIGQFERGIVSYVGKPAGFVTDRSGSQTDATGLSISLSLLMCRSTAGWTPETLSEKAARLKKKAKAQAGNSIAWEEIGERNAEARARDLTVH